MRISSGKLKGRKIDAGKASGTQARHGALRPTSSKVREAVFNILGERIKGARFADLYAGTGAVGTEAISRGAEKVFFIEGDGKRAELIRDALERYGCSSNAEVFVSDAADFTRKAKEKNMKFDIIFLDPPYLSGEIDSALSLISDGALLVDDGIVIAEHLSKRRLPGEMGSLRQKKSYKYGDTMLTLFRKVG